MTSNQTIQDAQHLLKGGDYFAVCDCVQRSLEESDFNLEMVYLGLLALAKSGATNQALELYETHKERVPKNGEFLSLLARLHKDLCIQSQTMPKSKNSVNLAAISTLKHLIPTPLITR